MHSFADFCLYGVLFMLAFICVGIFCVGLMSVEKERNFKVFGRGGGVVAFFLFFFTWTNPGDTAIQDQTVTEVEEAPSNPSCCKNQLNICSHIIFIKLSCWMYSQIHGRFHSFIIKAVPPRECYSITPELTLQITIYSNFGHFVRTIFLVAGTYFYLPDVKAVSPERVIIKAVSPERGSFIAQRLA